MAAVKVYETTYDVSEWDEKPVSEEPQKVTRTSFLHTFKTGGFIGEGRSDYIFTYQTYPDACTFTGSMHFIGTIGGSGKGEVDFKLDNGVWATPVASGKWVVDESSATGGLKGLKGSGEFEAKGMVDLPATFKLELPSLA